MPKPVLTINTTIPEKETNSVTFFTGDDEMLRVAPDGFYVRGVKLDQNELEAIKVYEAFTEWLSWQILTS